MSADLRLMSSAMFWHYERNEKQRIHEGYQNRSLSTLESRAAWDNLGESLDLWLRYRGVLKLRGYLTTLELD